MSEAMIIRRGGGTGKLSPNNAILRVVTSTGCSVTVSNSSAGYSKTHADSDGFAWSSDANVKDHFFEIPSSAFGTITVVATNTYGTNTKTLTVNTAGKVYEALVSAPNIILNSTFGLQSGYSWVSSNAEYNDYYKAIRPKNGKTYVDGYLSPNVPITAFETLTVTASRLNNQDGAIVLEDAYPKIIATASIRGYNVTVSAAIENKYYETAKLKVALAIGSITEIILS